jgi:hypothetical protein
LIRACELEVKLIQRLRVEANVSESPPIEINDLTIYCEPIGRIRRHRKINGRKMMETFRNHPKYVRRTRRRIRKLVGKAKTPQLRIPD